MARQRKNNSALNYLDNRQAISMLVSVIFHVILTLKTYIYIYGLNILFVNVREKFRGVEGGRGGGGGGGRNRS